MNYTKSFPIQFDPIASAAAMITAHNIRITVLTSRLLRLEYSPNNKFEDRPSQAFWYRKQPVPEFEVVEENGRISLETEHLHLTYQGNDFGFTHNSLQITLKQNSTVWHYGQIDPYNLLGTTRTLDNIDGAIDLEEGLTSRSGWAVYDDTERLVFNEDGWLTSRHAPAGYQDLYFFGYGQDYYACLRDFSKIAGPAPMIPRWALGNWWSRYWAYTETELLGLMDEFKANNVPLSVCIVDMDWHITETGNASSGWTGYTWNRELFPDPQQFIAALHERDLKTALNLHPATGIYPHEEQYPAMAKHMGLDPESEEPIPFGIADPQFTEGYFKLLHHPQEADGIDFWWMDWQQGTSSGLPGLDPLWWLNHLHFYDLGREATDGKKRKRPFIFSRWGDLGNHRYPIGFSGDTIVTWESLQFQPYFTAVAANVNYGWWSHDIGGHMGGIEEPELYARWIQYGVFSPILRMHCTNNPFHERRPWGYNAEIARVSSDALRLRHALIPYLYTMSWRNHSEDVPLIRPMYYDYPQNEQAYHCPDQYTYGSELLAAPFITPAEENTRHSRQVVWLPPDTWFNFFDGTKFQGDQWTAIYGQLEDIPLFAKAGAIVPLAPKVGWGGIANPDTLELHLFPGANNQFALYEDDEDEMYSLLPIESEWSSQSWTATVNPVQGETNHLPTSRTYVVKFRGVIADATLEATINGKEAEITQVYDQKTNTWTVTAVSINHTDTLTITITTEADRLLIPDTTILDTCQKLVSSFRMESWTKRRLFNQLPNLVANPAGLAHYQLELSASQMRALLETITGAGYHRSPTRTSDDEQIVLWNKHQNDAVSFKLVAVDLNRKSTIRQESLPTFAVFTIGKTEMALHVGTQPSQGRLSVADWLAFLPHQVNSDLVADLDVVVQFNIGDTQAYLTLDHGNAQLTTGVHEQPNITIETETAVWLALINGDKTGEDLFLSGQISANGKLELLMLLVEAIQLAPSAKYRTEKYKLDVTYLDMLTLPLGN